MSLVVDLFAGGGGVSLGIRQALGRGPDIAINHDPEAVAMHALNHPETRHLCGDVWDVRPREICGSRPVSLLWASPDCKHFSKAKGAKPVEKRIRSLAWVVVRWARDVRPHVIALENVEEFSRWGPLGPDQRPIKSLECHTFRRWVRELEALGYRVEWRALRACDYGAPTSRKRLFVIARRDGLPIVWPEPTHGPGRAPYRTAAECIDWSLPCPSIFLSAEEGRRISVRRPLAEATLARIARGLRRFVLDTSNPFVVPVAGGLIAPTLVQTGYGERPGQLPRSLDLHAPLGAVVGCGGRHALVAAFLAKHFGGNETPGAELGDPMSTVTCRDHHALVIAHVTNRYSTSADRLADVRAFLLRYNGQGLGQQLDLPLGAVTTRDRFGLVLVHGELYRIEDIGMRMLQPRELFRAQGFPDSYVVDLDIDGRPLTKTAQIRMCGNSVCPPIAEAIVRANLAAEAVAA